MRSNHEIDVPVLIAGAGPAGLTAAITLARHGVESLLVERRDDLSSLPRATAISTRSMELVRAWGLEAEVRAGGIECEWVGWTSETLATAAAGEPFPTGMPSAEQSALISPVAPACVPQDHLEPVLLGHLQELGAARVLFGAEVVGVTSRPEGVEALVRERAGGEPRTVRARYVIAADGAHSRVRNALGIAMRGPERLAEVVTALFRAPLWELLGDRRHGIYGVTHPRGLTFLPAGTGDRWLLGVFWDPASERAADFTEERLEELIRAGAGAPDLEPRIERTGAFSFAAKMADRFRAQSAFLVGDAAHRVTPRGGTGMNTAIHGAFDLGWKLGWVLNGWAGDALLDSYEVERRPVAQHNVMRSADPNGTAREPADVLHADLGPRIPHAWLPAASGRTSTLDLLGRGLTLFTGPHGGAWTAAAAGLEWSPPITDQALDAGTARAIGIRGDGALLARPDGAPAGLWTHAGDAAAALVPAVAAAAGAAGALTLQAA